MQFELEANRTEIKEERKEQNRYERMKERTIENEEGDKENWSDKKRVTEL